MESSREIEERAGAWLARRESGDWSAEDEARFSEWLNASTANRVAFLRQEAAWEHALRLQALRGRTPPGSVPSPDDWRLSPFVSDGAVDAHSHDGEQLETSEADEEHSCAAEAHEPGVRADHHKRSWWIRGTLAAGLMLVIAGAITWYASTNGPYYHTAVGGIASVPMSDGSKVTLNTQSAIRLAVSETERRVQLERGEAFFEVAKDPNRPFVVSAGGKRVIAVGTKFSVRREGSDLRVFVTEGKVRFEDDSLLASSATSPSHQAGSSSGKAKDRDASNAMLLTAGAVARAGESGVIVQEKPLTVVEDYLSWRSGYLTFRDIPLADAIAEFNRYNERKIVIQDPAVAAIRFSGKVRPTSFEGFVRLLEDAFSIRAEHVDGRIVLTAAPSSGEQASVVQ
jgi:transmembrane sensor